MITPLGVGRDATWEGLLAGRSGLSAAAIPGRLAPLPCGQVRGFDPETWIPSKPRRLMGRYAQLAVAAAKLAWEDSGLDAGEGLRLDAGCVIGNAAGGLPEVEEYKESLDSGTRRSRIPAMLPRMLPSQAAGYVAAALGLRGPQSCVSTACASGNNAIGTALQWIRYGDASVVVTGSTEACLSETCLADLEHLHVLSSEARHFEAACRPFDRDRRGLVPAEGAGILILEDEESARRRGAHIYCEIAGYGSSADGFHPVAPRPDAGGIVQCITRALRDARIDPAQVGYVNAHGTGTRVGDEVETLGIKKALGAHALEIAVSSTKSMLGHLLGGCGGVEAIITALAIEHGQIPPTINYESPDPACDLDYVPNVARDQRIDTALSTAFGFGGNNAAIVLRRYHG